LRQTNDRETYRQTLRQTNDRETSRHTVGTNKQTCIQIKRPTDRQIDAQTDKEMHITTERLTGRLTDVQVHTGLTYM
jgi:hypothetical protein